MEKQIEIFKLVGVIIWILVICGTVFAFVIYPLYLYKQDKSNKFKRPKIYKHTENGLVKYYTISYLSFEKNKRNFIFENYNITDSFIKDNNNYIITDIDDRPNGSGSISNLIFRQYVIHAKPEKIIESQKRETHFYGPTQYAEQLNGEMKMKTQISSKIYIETINEIKTDNSFSEEDKEFLVDIVQRLKKEEKVPKRIATQAIELLSDIGKVSGAITAIIKILETMK